MSCLKRAKDNNGQHLYLGVYIDLKSRFVVGYFFTGLNKIHIDTKNAFKKILRRRIMINGKSLKIRRPKIHHSDRGSNYTALEYHSYLTSHKILQS
jgi:transposase InsO family protein